VKESVAGDVSLMIGSEKMPSSALPTVSAFPAPSRSPSRSPVGLIQEVTAPFGAQGVSEPFVTVRGLASIPHRPAAVGRGVLAVAGVGDLHDRRVDVF
jgi:hypothetical protein